MILEEMQKHATDGYWLALMSEGRCDRDAGKSMGFQQVTALRGEGKKNDSFDNDGVNSLKALCGRDFVAFETQVVVKECEKRRNAKQAPHPSTIGRLDKEAHEKMRMSRFKSRSSSRSFGCTALQKKDFEGIPMDVSGAWR